MFPEGIGHVHHLRPVVPHPVHHLEDHLEPQRVRDEVLALHILQERTRQEVPVPRELLVPGHRSPAEPEADGEVVRAQVLPEVAGLPQDARAIDRLLRGVHQVLQGLQSRLTSTAHGNHEFTRVKT